MRVLLVRHAIAEERGAFTGADAERPLTPEGIRRFRRVARALAGEAPRLARIVSSPLARACETAALLHQAYPDSPVPIELDALVPGGPARAVLEFLRRQRRLTSLALIGHEPELSQLEALLVSGGERPLARFKKGGAALLDFAGTVAAGRATMHWHLTSSQLRRLAP